MSPHDYLVCICLCMGVAVSCVCMEMGPLRDCMIENLLLESC